MKVPGYDKLVYKLFGTQYAVSVEIETYANDGSLAIQLVTPMEDAPGFEEHFMKLTVNTGIELPENQIWLKDYSENEGAADWAHRVGIVEGKPTRCTNSGFVQICAYRLSDKFLKAVAQALAERMPK